MAGLQTTGVIIIIAILVLVVFIILKKPIKIVLKLVLNTVIGFIALFALNWLGSFVGITMRSTVLTPCRGRVGCAGVALVLLLQWLVRHLTGRKYQIYTPAASRLLRMHRCEVFCRIPASRAFFSSTGRYKSAKIDWRYQEMRVVR
jgi:inhibitor of the pro-sigma K processing machinery